MKKWPESLKSKKKTLWVPLNPLFTMLCICVYTHIHAGYLKLHIKNVIYETGQWIKSCLNKAVYFNAQ